MTPGFPGREVAGSKPVVRVRRALLKSRRHMQVVLRSAEGSVNG
jgi:hypothetical protein